MKRPVVSKPAPEFNLPMGTYLLVLKYLYGLADSGDAWYHKLRSILLKILNMVNITGDLSCYMLKDENDILLGIVEL